MTSSNGNILRVTGPLWGESTGHRWIPLTKASTAEIWCFLLSTPKQTAEQTIEAPVIWDDIALIITSLWCSAVRCISPIDHCRTHWSLLHMDQHYNDVIVGSIASQITSLASVDSTVYSGVDQRKHKSSAWLALVWGIHQGPVNPQWPVTRKMLPGWRHHGGQWGGLNYVSYQYLPYTNSWV